MGYILAWLYNYGKLCTDGQYAFITLVYGNASLWGMIAAPFCIKRWGKKWTMIVTNLFNILFIACLYPAVSLHVNFPQLCIWVVLVFLWLNALMNSFAVILTPAVNADIRDYQHFITGERIDGMFAAVSLITSFITMATNSVIPLIFDKYGINEHNGYENAFDILGKEPRTLYALINLLIVLSVIGAAFNVIPYFFYDLSEKKQRGMIAILKIRAMFEDFGNGQLSDSEIIEGVEVMRAADENFSKEIQIPDKSLSRRERRAIALQNEEIEIGRMVKDEYNKFTTEEFEIKCEMAQQTVDAGLEGILAFDDRRIAEARVLPTGTETEKAIRKYSLETAKQMRTSRRTINRRYNGVIPEFDESIFDTLFAAEEENDEAQRKLYEQLDSAPSNEKEALKVEIAKLKKEGRKINADIRKASKESSVYYRVIKPYASAEKLLRQREDYKHYAEIEAMYDGAKQRAAEEEERSAREAKAEAEQKRLDRENRKKK
jgi:hypothetical protein